MTDTVAERAGTTADAAHRPVMERLTAALTTHLSARSITAISGILFAIGLGYTWATALFVQAGRSQLVITYGLPALVLTVTGALGLAVARRAARADRTTRPASRWRTGLARGRIRRSSVRTGPPEAEQIHEQPGEQPGRAVVVRDHTPDDTPGLPEDVAPAPAPTPAPAPAPVARRGRHAWRDEEREAPEEDAATPEPTTPLHRVTNSEATPDPSPETTPMAAIVPPRAVPVRPAPRPRPAPAPAEPTEAPADEPATEVAEVADVPGDVEVTALPEAAAAPTPAPVARLRPVKKSGASGKAKRTTRVAGRPSGA